MIPLELTPLLKPAQAAPGAAPLDQNLEAGDVVVIPDLQPIFAIGAVNTPGAVSPAQADTVSELVVMAGGLADDADRRAAYVLRDGEQIPVDLALLFDEGDSSQDVPVQPRDALIVPRRAQVVHVAGAVLRPGAYPLEQAPSVLDIWALAGGPDLMADSAHALLLRGEETEELNLEALAHRGDMSQNRQLRAGDTLLIPRIQDEVYVFGAVARPGVHPIHEGDTVIDVLADAGGPVSGANVKKIALIRRSVVEQGRREELYDRPRGADQAPPADRSARPTRPTRGSSPERPPSTRGTGERAAARGDRVEQVAQKLAEGTEAVSLFDLARVPEGDPRFLVRPGDVIYVPARQVETNEFRQIILQIVSSLIAGALL
jgi:protein involved in polysaccharide export with SLBB domain